MWHKSLEFELKKVKKTQHLFTNYIDQFLYFLVILEILLE